MTQSNDHRCTLVVPTYNAAGFISKTASRLRQFIFDHPDWCVLFVCDGCSDETVARLSAEIPGSNPAMQIQTYARNRGKGFAIRRALSLVKTPYIVYTDVDLAYGPAESLKILRLLEDGADLAVANRVDPESRFLISPCDFPSIYQRHRMSRTFNWWLRQMLPIEILDTQAGLKGITAAAWQRLSSHMVSDGFFFDVELLAWAGALRLKVAETAVTFSYLDPTTVRMIHHGWAMLLDTFRLRRRLKLAPADESALVGASGAS